jgi:hypothetical protein
MPPKRRFWNDEQKMTCGFSRSFSRVRLLDLGWIFAALFNGSWPKFSTHALEKCFENPDFIFCSFFPNLRLEQPTAGLESIYLPLPNEDLGKRNSRSGVSVRGTVRWVVARREYSRPAKYLENTRPTRCSVFPNLRLGSIDLRPAGISLLNEYVVDIPH